MQSTPRVDCIVRTTPGTAGSLYVRRPPRLCCRTRLTSCLLPSPPLCHQCHDHQCEHAPITLCWRTIVPEPVSPSSQFHSGAHTSPHRLTGHRGHFRHGQVSLFTTRMDSLLMVRLMSDRVALLANSVDVLLVSAASGHCVGPILAEGK